MKLTLLALVSGQLLLVSAGPLRKGSELELVQRQAPTTEAVSSEAPATTGTPLSPSGNSTGIAPTGASSDTPSSTASEATEEPTEAPAYNLENKTCAEVDLLKPAQQWEAVNGEETVKKFQQMLSDNLLLCEECFGKTKEECDSDNEQCKNGLADLSMDSDGTARWDTAAGIFNSIETDDLRCAIGTTKCSSAMTCEDARGPGSWVIAESLVTMNNLYNNIHQAIGDAGQFADTQMQTFQETFAPVPDTKSDSLFLTLFTSITAGLAGFVPGIGAAYAGLVVGVGNAVTREMFIQNLPKPKDTDSTLGLITKNTQDTYKKLTDALFKTGEYTLSSANGAEETKLTLAEFMKGGDLLNPKDDGQSFLNELVPVYEKILFQQLAVYTWANLQSDKKGHVPFIAFDNSPCAEVDDKDEKTVVHEFLKGAHKLDSNVEINGTCYYLLDGATQTQRREGSHYDADVCTVKALPGGTKKSMDENKDKFMVSLEDFVVPSVEGWLAHNKDNAYPLASTDGKLVDKPTAPGAVNLPICDYMGNPKSPGVGCPMVGEVSKDDICVTYDPDSQDNAPGVANPGWCRLNVKQYQRREDNLNPLDVYQLEINVFDELERKVGQATKQAAGSPLEVSDTSLPYNLIVAPGGADEDPVSFWYSDSFWTSEDKDAHQCSVGSFDNGQRSMDCGFPCPPKKDDPVSATVEHKLPAAPTKAVGGAKSFVNTYPVAEPTGEPTPEPEAPSFEGGFCGMHVTQYQKNEEKVNPIGDYSIEMTIFDGKQKAIASSGKIAVPDGKETEIKSGLAAPILITPGAIDSDPFKVKYNGAEWSTYDADCSAEKSQKYDNGKREFDCGFSC